MISSARATPHKRSAGRENNSPAGSRSRLRVAMTLTIDADSPLGTPTRCVRFSALPGHPTRRCVSPGPVIACRGRPRTSVRPSVVVGARPASRAKLYYVSISTRNGGASLAIRGTPARLPQLVDQSVDGGGAGNRTRVPCLILQGFSGELEAASRLQ